MLGPERKEFTHPHVQQAPLLHDLVEKPLVDQDEEELEAVQAVLLFRHAPEYGRPVLHFERQVRTRSCCHRGWILLF